MQQQQCQKLLIKACGSMKGQSLGMKLYKTIATIEQSLETKT